jgi:hypothetical protein
VLTRWTGGASGGRGRPGSLCSRRFSSVSVSQVATELHVLHVLAVHLRLLQVHSEAQNSVSSTAGQHDILTQTVKTWLGGSRTIPPPATAGGFAALPALASASASARHQQTMIVNVSTNKTIVAAAPARTPFLRLKQKKAPSHEVEGVVLLESIQSYADCSLNRRGFLRVDVPSSRSSSLTRNDDGS